MGILILHQKLAGKITSENDISVACFVVDSAADVQQIQKSSLKLYFPWAKGLGEMQWSNFWPSEHNANQGKISRTVE